MGLDQLPFRGGGDTVIVDESALAPESNPLVYSSVEVDPALDKGDISLYVVREGDSISEIARMFGVSINTIAWANDLKRGAPITPGQELVILPISGVRHEVVKGDTLQSIAKLYHGNLEEITHFNDLEVSTPLIIGQEVIIPDGEIAAPAPSPSSAGNTGVVRGGGPPAKAGYYLRPIAGGKKSQGIHGYNGVDLAAPIGASIFAAADGTVMVSREGGWNGGYGNYVVIKHGNGTQTLYAHNQKNLVRVGQVVTQGQAIGLVGSTGKSTGPHVHFEVRGAKNPF